VTAFQYKLFVATTEAIAIGVDETVPK